MRITINGFTYDNTQIEHLAYENSKITVVLTFNNVDNKLIECIEAYKETNFIIEDKYNIVPLFDYIVLDKTYTDHGVKIKIVKGYTYEDMARKEYDKIQNAMKKKSNDSLESEIEYMQ